MSSKGKTEKVKAPAKGLSKAEKIVGVIIILLVIWGVYSFAVSSSPPPVTSTTQTSGSHVSLAPDFTLPVVGRDGLTGDKLTLSSFRGKVVVVEFMEPWCEYCKQMAPTMEQLYDQYASQDIVFLAVSGPAQGATPESTAQYIRDYNSRMIYVFDTNGGAFNSYGISSTPTFYIIAKNGSAFATYSGVQTFETMASVITRAASA